MLCPVNSNESGGSKPVNSDKLESEQKAPVVSLQTHFNIMKQALVKYPNVNIQVMGQSIPSLLLWPYGTPDVPELFQSIFQAQARPYSRPRYQNT